MSKIDSSRVEDMLSLSPNQEGILFHYLQNPEGNQYKIQLKLSLRGIIDRKVFEQAWNKVIQSNEMLRTVFRWIGISQPVQVLLKQHEPSLMYVDFSDLSAEDTDKLLNEAMIQDYDKPLDLERECYRISLYKLGSDEYMMLFTVHHIVYDGWSNNILLTEFLSAYQQVAEGKVQSSLKKMPIRAFIKHVNHQDKTQQQAFWSSYMSGLDSIPLFPASTRIKPTKKPELQTYQKKLPADLRERLDLFLRQHHISLSAMIYAAWGVLLQFYCNSTDVVFGRVSSGRNLNIKGIQDMIGMFINVHPFRVNPAGSESVVEWVRSIQSSSHELEPFEATPLTDIKRYLSLQANQELFNTIVVIENYPLDKQAIMSGSSLTVTDYSIQESNHYDVTLLIEAFDDLALKLIYRQDCFEPWFMERVVKHLINILTAMVDKADQPISSLMILSEKEEKQLQTFNETDADYPAHKTIVDLFEERVQLQPDDVAVVRQDCSLTYRDLNERANGVAHHLLSLGVTANQIVGVVADRSAEMIAGIFGILKSGAAYLPIDPNIPRNRIHFIMKDAGIDLILVQKDYLGLIPDDVQAVCLEEKFRTSLTNPEVIRQPNDICYVIYTSGTTGMPKGVMIEHHSLVNRLAWMQKNSPICKGDVILQKTTYSFDVSVWELFWWAIQGASLCLLEKGAEKNPQALFEAIQQNHITVVHFVPSAMHAFLSYLEVESRNLSLSALKYVITSGEALPLESVRRFYDRCKTNNRISLINLYGPTEATIDVSYYNCSENGVPDEAIPIGKPIDNIQLAIVNPYGQLQPLGLPGELWISGVGLARGYLNQPELTQEKFITNGLEGKKFYKTGDLAKWRPDGQIEYIGRIDSQVKVRGYRIELGEVESGIRKVPGVKDVVVLVQTHDDGLPHLYAYVVMDRPIEDKEMRKLVAAELPDYMIPSYFVAVEYIPVKANGKVDKAALSLIPVAAKQTFANKGITKPQNDVQSQIMQIWCNVLGRDDISIYDNYFDIGGNSINLIRLYGKLSVLFKDRISITTLFQYPSIAALTDYVTEEKTEAAENKNASEETVREIAGEPDASDASLDIAVIGLAGRFPEAENIREYWDNLLQGKEAIHFFTEEELKQAGVDEAKVQHPNYVNAAGRLKGGVDQFDANFFGYSPKEAGLLDPQIRLLLETAWETLEDAGYTSQHSKEVIGMYAGASPNLFWEIMALRSKTTETLGAFASEKLLNKDHLSAQIAYRLNLTGPVFSLYTACSTSLVAVHLACQALQNNECTVALAGGVSAVVQHVEHGYIYQDGMFYSPDGHCKAFDKHAAGFSSGTGVGLVALKRLSKAISDGDQIYAVIKGTAITNDGNRKIGYAAPSIEAQSEAVKQALKKAGVDPEDIGYIETHGAGTELGDPVEMKALELAFESKKKNFCAIGSVKASIGHLDTAAGIAGLIKTILSVKHKKLVPSLNFEIPNPRIHFIDTPFYMNTELNDWENEGKPLRAGVNSLGLGGTNAHVIIEEYRPDKPEEATRPETESVQLIVLSAKSDQALRKQAQNLLAHLAEYSDLALADVAFTLQTGRRSMGYRKAFAVTDYTSLTEQLSLFASDTAGQVTKSEEQLEVVLRFGQFVPIDFAFGSDEAMVPIWKEELDQISRKVFEISGVNLHTAEGQTHPIGRKLAAFIQQYVNVRCLIRAGIKPTYLAEDTTGEILAAALAGKYSIQEAVQMLLHSTASYSFDQQQEELLSGHRITVNLGNRHLFELLGEIWEAGFNVDWMPCYCQEKPNKVSLPSYPFEKSRYWIEGNSLQGIHPDSSSGKQLAKSADLADWFYAPAWHQTAVESPSPKEQESWLIFAGEDAFSLDLIQTLQEMRHEVRIVSPGSKFAVMSETNFTIDPANEKHYEQLIAELTATSKVPTKIIHAWSLITLCCKSDREHIEQAQTNGFFSLIQLAKAIADSLISSPIHMYALTEGAFSVTGDETLQPAYATVSSACLVIAQEISRVRCQHIDITKDSRTPWQKISLLKQVVQEFSTPLTDTTIAYRNAKRWVRNYQQMKLEPTSNVKLREKGVYLLVGGLGGVGLVLSRYLAQKTQAKLVLVGRSPLPDITQWDQWMASHQPDDPTSRKIAAIREMEALGSKVVVVSADAEKESDMQQVISRIHEQFGELHGVIYGAAAKGDSLFKTISEIDKDGCWEQFRPKVLGTQVLENVLKDIPLDFCLMMSSTSSILGGLGFVGYSAANAYMDAFTLKHNQEHPTKWLTVNWESWDVDTNQTKYDYQAEIQNMMMTKEEGTHVFERLLSVDNQDQLIVSSGELAARMDRWVKLSFINNEPAVVGDSGDQRAEVTSEYMAPTNKLEEVLVQVWSEFFGIKHIGIHDKLFELGATSLSIIQLNENLRKKLGMNIPIVKFFTYPTIHSLANYLEESEKGAVTASEQAVKRQTERVEMIEKGRNSAQRRKELRKN